jgi:hypothetical protein
MHSTPSLKAKVREMVAYETGKELMREAVNAKLLKLKQKQ